jgi:MFS family permease
MLSLPALNGLIIDLSYKQRKGKIAGIWDLFMDTGYVIGPILGGWIASHFGLRIVFSVIGMVFLTSVSILLIIRYEELSINSENIRTKSIPK